MSVIRRILKFYRSSWVGRRSTGSLAGEPRDFIYQYLMRFYVNLKLYTLKTKWNIWLWNTSSRLDTDSQAHPRAQSNPDLLLWTWLYSGRCYGLGGAKGKKVMLTLMLDLTLTLVTCSCSSYRNDSPCQMEYSIPSLMGEAVTVLVGDMYGSCECT